jgi:polar amino acid transport system substrate-binding protein
MKSSARRLITSFAGLLLAATALSACGGGTPEGASVQAPAGLLGEVTTSKTLAIGTSNDAPWSTVTNGNAEGIVPDILREFFTRAGIPDVQIKSTPMPFDSLIPSVGSKRIQMIGDAMFATDERAQKVDFTRTLFYNTEAMVVAPGNPKQLRTVADLCGKVGATYKGTTWVTTLEKASKACPGGGSITVKTYSTVYEVMQDVAAGRVDGALIDGSIAAYALRQNPGLKIALAPDYVSPDRAASDNALAIPKGDPAFVEKFNTVYSEMLADGTAAKIFDKWGLTPSDQWLAPA